MFSLFVHVPPFSKVPKETQLEFMHDLFEKLAMCVLEGWEDGQEKEEVVKEEVNARAGTKEINKKGVGKGSKVLRKCCSIM
jgi:hypothetical protein